MKPASPVRTMAYHARAFLWSLWDMLTDAFWGWWHRNIAPEEPAVVPFTPDQVWYAIGLDDAMIVDDFLSQIEPCMPRLTQGRHTA